MTQSFYTDRNKYKQRAEKENKTITWGDWGKETVT